MRVLLTNHTFAVRGGTELFARDVGLALIRRGHTPVLYSSRLGAAAKDFRREGLTVVDQLDELEAPPDLIHAHHHLDAMTACLRFPRVPAVLFCHGVLPWEETPVRFPSIRRHIAIDDPSRDRLVAAGIPGESIRVLRTAVDLHRFRLRAALPDRPRRALVFSNYASHDERLRIVRAACGRAGISRLDALGGRVGNDLAHPEEILGDYDLVFAKGRAAHEAAATGAAVIIADYGSFGGLLTSENYEKWRALNFGFRALTRPLALGPLAAEIARYDAADATAVAQRLRADADLEPAVDRLIAIYQEALAEQPALAATAPAEFDRAGSDYVRSLALHIKDHMLDRPVEAMLARLWHRFVLRFRSRRDAPGRR